MLVVISDLHFLDESAGRHNPAAGAFERIFFPHIVSLARSRGARELKLLLLGDTFDFIRTEHWFRDPLEDRPWGRNGLADIPVPHPGSATERRALSILGTLPADGKKESVPEDTILHRNWESLRFFREFPDRLRAELGAPDLPVEVILMPGNHDRIINLYPSVRDAARDILGVTVARGTVEGDPEGEWWYLNEYRDEAHGVFARHGQQFDFWNYGGGADLSRRGHIEMSIGEVLGVEFGAKLPYRLAELRKEFGEIPESLIDSMKDMGLVRPFTDALEWLHYSIKSMEKGNVRDALQRAFREIFQELLDIPYVRSWSSPATKLDGAVRFAGTRWISWIPRILIRRLHAENLLPFFLGIGAHPQDPDKDIHLQAAYREKVWREDSHVRYILYGHTHFPVQRPLEGDRGRSVVYINTGSFRESIFKALGIEKKHDFMKFRQITFSMFYRGDEDLEGKETGALSYETWSGQKKNMHL